MIVVEQATRLSERKNVSDDLLKFQKGGYGDISYGPNWYRQRKRALERDDFECQMPGCTIDREAHRKR